MTDDVSESSTRAANPRLDALLKSKPPTDQVSLAAWWFVVSSLESSVPVRRAVEGVEVLSTAALARAVSRAQNAVRAALEELPTGVESLPLAAQGAQNYVPRLHTTIRTLALLVVTPRVTTTQQLTAALIHHWHAISRCHPNAVHGLQPAVLTVPR